MKNVTISLDDATHRRARIRAAEMGKSLSGLIRELIDEMESKHAAGEQEIMVSGLTRAEFDRRAASERRLRDLIDRRAHELPPRSSPDRRLARDEVHDRDRLREEFDRAQR